MSPSALTTRLAFIALLAFALPVSAGQSTADSAAPVVAQPASAATAAAATAPAAGQEKVAVSSATADDAKKMTCRTVRVTGSNLRTRKVCSTPNSEKNASDWVREQQDRGAIGASAILNSGGG